VEKHILALEAADESNDEVDGEKSLEEKALDLAIDEIYQGNGQKWKPLASNARSLRIGDIILIVDSDTTVPEVPRSSLRSDGGGSSLSLGLFQGCCPRVG
jgi:hypothetical protein